jgi:hypothetical protein
VDSLKSGCKGQVLEVKVTSRALVTLESNFRTEVEEDATPGR